MKKLSIWVLSTIFVVLVISSCGPNAAELSATATAYIATSDALKQAYFLTKTAEPTRTPAPTLPPDTRSPFEKCAYSGRGVRYVISGSSVSRISLTFGNDTGGTDQGDYSMPFCKIYKGFQHGDFLYISAQIISGEGKIKCQIFYRTLTKSL